MAYGSPTSIEFPERYHIAVTQVEAEYGDLETNQTLSDDNKLILYALRQQADKGPCTDPAPYIWNVAARYKHSSWLGLGNMSKPEAMVHYTRQVDKLLPGWLDKAVAEREAAEKKDGGGGGGAVTPPGGDSIELPASPLPLGATTPAAAGGATSTRHRPPLPTPSTPPPVDITPPPSTGISSSSADGSSGSSSDHQHQQHPHGGDVGGGGSCVTTATSSTVSSFETCQDISVLSDAQVAALLSSPDGRIPTHVARGLINEVLRLRKALVMTTSFAPMTATTRSPKVEHRYYGGGSSFDRSNAAAAASTSNNSGNSSNNNNNAASSSASSGSQPGDQRQRKGGWFSWFVGSEDTGVQV